MSRVFRAVWLLATLSLCSQCRFLLGPDDARPPVSDADASDGPAVPDGADIADGDDGPSNRVSRLECDLLLQDCPDKRGCYPDEKLQGDTFCAFKGAGGPLSPCMLQEDCDVRLACISSDPGNPASGDCVQLCRPLAGTTGCQPGLLCVTLPGYTVGYCRF
ncbi:MAG: hypothetical protein QOI66_823 [Myxococcales bacterium]|nr:hypothetical protein [Myxococcales bacterium]